MNDVTVAIEGWIYGNPANSPTSTATFGGNTVIYSYSNAENGTFESTVPTDAGIWYVKAFVPATDNYPSGEAVTSFVIARNQIDGKDLSDEQKPAGTTSTYDEEEHPLVDAPQLPEGYKKVEYSTDGGKTWQDEIPTGVESGDYEITIRYVPDDNHEEIVMTVTATISRAMEMQVDLFLLQYNGTRGLPKEIDNLTLKPEIHVKSGNIESVSKGLEFELKQGMENKVSYENVEFTGKVTDPAPGKYEVKVEGLPLSIFEQGVIYSTDAVINGPIKWKYALSTHAEINEKNGIIVITVYLIFDDGSRPDEIAVYALPEDEIGAYAILQDGTKEYLLFHTYDICMNYLGSDELCRSYERCFHKEGYYAVDWWPIEIDK